MIGLLCFILAVLASPFKSKVRLEAENAVLRHQLIVLRRRPHGRVRLTNHDRWFFIQLYRWFPSILQVLTIIRLETLVRWHRAGFCRYWRSKSRRRGGCAALTSSMGTDHRTSSPPHDPPVRIWHDHPDDKRCGLGASRFNHDTPMAVLNWQSRRHFAFGERHREASS
jgi:hypothetical protein